MRDQLGLLPDGGGWIGRRIIVLLLDTARRLLGVRSIAPSRLDIHQTSKRAVGSFWRQSIERVWLALFPPANVRVARALNRILERQVNDAQDKMNESWYWGAIGGDVFDATRRAAAALHGIAFHTDVDAYLRAVEEAVAEAHERYRRGAVDEGGYGSATFHAIRRDIEKLRQRRRY